MFVDALRSMGPGVDGRSRLSHQCDGGGTAWRGRRQQRAPHIVEARAQQADRADEQWPACVYVPCTQRPDRKADEDASTWRGTHYT